MRLMGTIIVALLALTMAILPISMSQAAAPAGHGPATAVNAGHEHAAVDGDHEHADVLASCDDTALSGFSDQDGDTQDCTGLICCSMGACHAFQGSAPPSLYSPAASQAPMVMAGDEQVGGITAGGLDRPPRTV
ncbi:hypothetical protein [Microvirga sp. VF16]|uniref:hypothetical protein n=1 Tax=Microvirga sp. VF16 TaxID=2807101 RepID=UPI00193E1801|nr:hypothetical protein [Microvirga sp. VF16]QRM34655.1 hypothetical protein JO965_40925 [Microvirga sp. VF16]